MMSNDNFKKVSRVLWVIMFANLAVALLKIIVGSIIKSASMAADGFHSLTDGSSNIIGLIAIRFASKPKDEDHPYGHRKFETLASLVISGMLVFIGGKIIYDAVLNFLHPIVPEVTLPSILALLATLAVNIFVSRYEYSAGKRLGSQILISDSMHTRSDIYVSVGVLVTLIGVRLGLPAVIDPIASLIVAGFILHAAWEIFGATSGVLLDRAVADAETIKEIVLGFEQVRDVHKIRSRGCAPDLYIDLHIMTNPGMSVEESHSMIHDMEEKMQNALGTNVELIAHIEPFRETSNQ